MVPQLCRPDVHPLALAIPQGAAGLMDVVLPGAGPRSPQALAATTPEDRQKLIKAWGDEAAKSGFPIAYAIDFLATGLNSISDPVKRLALTQEAAAKWMIRFKAPPALMALRLASRTQDKEQVAAPLALVAAQVARGDKPEPDWATLRRLGSGDGRSYNVETYSPDSTEHFAETLLQVPQVLEPQAEQALNDILTAIGNDTTPRAAERLKAEQPFVLAVYNNAPPAILTKLAPILAKALAYVYAVQDAKPKEITALAQKIEGFLKATDFTSLKPVVRDAQLDKVTGSR
jgi:hypothetical protein